MSTLKTNNVQVGQSVTATDNFTLYQPSTPDGTVRLGNGNSGSVTDVARFTSAGVFSFNSGYGSVAAAYGCRAWVNFNGTGTIAIRGSGNVSSITDGGVGLYTVNFTNAMPDANYATCALGYATVADSTTLRGIQQKGDTSTGSVQVFAQNGLNNNGYDSAYVSVAIFR